MQLSRVLSILDSATRQQMTAVSFPGVDPRQWQTEVPGCEKLNPQKLICKGFELIVEPGGITAQARSAGMDILYTLHLPFEGGPVSCRAFQPAGEDLCAVLQ